MRKAQIKGNQVNSHKKKEEEGEYRENFSLIETEVNYHLLLDTKIIGKMTPLSVRPRKNSVSTLTTSPCVYEFCCSSGCKYIGRTVRNLSTRIGEHLPSWLRLEGNGMSKSVILRHLYPITHRIDTEKVVKVIYRAKNKQSHLLKLSLFARGRLMFVQRSKW